MISRLIGDCYFVWWPHRFNISGLYKNFSWLNSDRLEPYPRTTPKPNGRGLYLPRNYETARVFCNVTYTPSFSDTVPRIGFNAEPYGLKHIGLSRKQKPNLPP